MLALTIEELRYFVEAGKCGSFSAAAEKLHISPQGLSQGIRHLEQDMNVLLFQRTTSGVSLSEIGLQVFDHASNILGSLDQIKTCVNGHRGKRTERLCCAVKSSRLGNTLKTHLDQFQKESGIVIEVVDFGNVKQRGKLLMSNKVDLLFEFKEILPKNDYYSEQLIFRSYMWPIFNVENSLTSKETLRWEDLRGITIIAESDKHIYIPYLKNKFQKYGLKPEFEFCFDAHYCLEVLSKSPEKVYFTTDSAYRQYLDTHKNLRCCSNEDPLYLEYTAFIKKELADDAVYHELTLYLRDVMKDYSALRGVKDKPQSM